MSTNPKSWEIVASNIEIKRPLNVLFFCGDGYSQALGNALGFRSRLVNLSEPLGKMDNPCRHPDGTPATLAGKTWYRAFYSVLTKALEDQSVSIDDTGLYAISEAVKRTVAKTPFFTFEKDGSFSAELPHAASQLRQLLYSAFAAVHVDVFHQITIENLATVDWPWLRMLVTFKLPPVRLKVVSLNYDLFLEQSLLVGGLKEVGTIQRSKDDRAMWPWDNEKVQFLKPHGSLRTYVPINHAIGFPPNATVLFQNCQMNLASALEIQDITNAAVPLLPDIVPPAHAGSHLLNPYCIHNNEITGAAETADVVVVFGASGRGPDLEEFEVWLKPFLVTNKPIFYIGTPNTKSDSLFSLLEQSKNFHFISTGMDKLGVPYLLDLLSKECGVKVSYGDFEFHPSMS